MNSASPIAPTFSAPLILSQLEQIAWPSEGQQYRLNVIVDCAMDESLEPIIANSGIDNLCLFKGEIHPVLKAVAPHVFEVTSDNKVFLLDLIEKGWGKSWMVFALTQGELDINSVSDVFRRIAKVKTEDGKVMFFRFQDARVMRPFLPTCDAEQLKQVFGTTSHYLCEGFDGDGIHKFTLDKETQALQSQEIPLQHYA